MKMKMKNQQRPQSIADFIRNHKEPKPTFLKSRQAWRTLPLQPHHLSDEDEMQRAIDASKASYVEEELKAREESKQRASEEVYMAAAITLSLESEASTWTEVKGKRSIK